MALAYSVLSATCVAQSSCPVGYTGPDGGPCAACLSGTFKDVNGSAPCIACPSNTFSANGSTSVTNCTCNVGFTGPDGGMTCMECMPSTYKNVSGSAQCVACSQGKYSDGTGRTICDDCPSDTHSRIGSNMLLNCTCNEGFTGPHGVSCTACAAGTYKDNVGSSACLPCAQGKYSTTRGAVSESACTKCPAHSYSNVGSALITNCICNKGYTGANGIDCMACDAGSFKDVNGSAACHFCSQGKYSTATAATFESVCTRCPSDTYSGLGSGVLTNCTCNKGFTGPDGLACTSCAAGSYKDVRGSSPCSLCMQGKYSPGTGLISESMCDNCPAHTNSQAGSSVITNCTCKAGYTGPDGVQCTPCGEHYYKTVSGSSPCLLCPPRSHTDGLTGQSECACYLESYGSDTLPLICHRCPVIAICLEDTQCALRNPVHVPESASFEFFCPGGRPIFGNWTRNASTGAYEIVSCPSGYQLLSSQDMGFPEKQECAPGIWTRTSCPFGHEVSTMKTGKEPFKMCAECGKSKECVSPPCGISSCTDCAAGFYKNTVGTYACLECPQNSYREGIHIEGCGCSPGLYGLYGNCSSCSPNHYCPGSGKLLPCPAGGFSSVGSSHLTDCNCTAGHYLSIPTDLDWEQMRQNVFMDLSNVSVKGEAGSWTCTSQCVDVQCVQCGLGRFSAGATTSCTSCPPRSTTLSRTSVSLIECVCESGYYLQGSECISCPEHMSSPAGSVQLTDCMCVPGYTGQDGDSCQSCAMGKYKSIPGSALCDLCGEGKYLHQHAGTACQSCPLLTTSLKGQTHVMNCSCIAGYTGPSGRNECKECRHGKYKNSFGSFECQQCPAGTYSDQTGNKNVSSCSACPPTMSSAHGSVSFMACICAEGYTGFNGDECFPCLAGTYKSIQGSSQCLECQLGKYSDLNASSSCIRCAAGKYSDHVGSTSDACTTCPAAKYSDILGATTQDNCESCGAGTFSEIVGANSSADCMPCPLGTYSPNEGMTSCSKCTAGKYGIVEGAKSSDRCLDCPKGTYGNQTAASSVSACSGCSAGKFSDQEGAVSGSVCESCLANTYAVEGSKMCSSCPLNSLSSPESQSVNDCTCLTNFTRSSPSGACFDPSAPCPEGTYTEGALVTGNFSCESCPPGTSSNVTGAQSKDWCQLCRPGSFSNAGASSCTACPEGSYGPLGSPNVSSTSCQECLAGQFTNKKGMLECLDCRAGTYNDMTGASGCMLCDSGTFSIAIGATTSDVCQKCPAGTSSQVRGRGSPIDCKLCSPATYSEAGASLCAACPPYGISLPGSTSRLDCVCSPGYTGPDGGPCLECLPGTFKADNGTSNCLSCQQGKFGNRQTAASHCNDCVVGSDSPPESDQIVDCLCNAGWFEPNGGTFQTLITAYTSTYTDSKTNSLVRMSFLVNEVWTSEQTLLSSPIAGERATQAMMNLDGPPTKLKLRNTGNEDWNFWKIRATVGRGAPEMIVGVDHPNGAQGSSAAENPYYWLMKSGGQDSLLLDLTSSQTWYRCMQCLTGTYKPDPGPSNCTACGRGWYSPVIAALNSSTCAPCVPGKYSWNVEAATADECIACEAGKYAGRNGTSICDDCEGGTYSTTIAAISISECNECAGGRYAAPGSSSCLICPAGTYAPKASSACIICPRDTYNPVKEAAVCLSCNLTFCETGQYRSRCRIGAISDATCLNCSYIKEHTIFIEHGEYNDTCPYICNPPYKLDCSTNLCKRCDPGTYSAKALVPNTIPPEFFESCRGCPEGAECDGTDSVICGFDRYLSMPDLPLGATIKTCEKCPIGASCIDGSCALKNMSNFRCPPGDTTELRGDWVRLPYNNRESTINPEFGRFELASCPQGHSMKGIVNKKVSQSEMQECEPCNRFLHYILDPNLDDCQRCPPGLECNGNNLTVPRTQGSEWSIQSPIMKLDMCPMGYKVWPALAPGETFDNSMHAPKQECQVCTEGMECTLDRCSTCSWCAAGKYKDTPGTVECRKCAAGKYNSRIGQKSESDCIRCVDGANTGPEAPYLEGAVSIHDCECSLNMYMSTNRTAQGGAIVMQCFKCPAAAMCPDGTCGLRNFPTFACHGIGSDSMPSIVGTWIRGRDQKYAVIGCPVGHRLINHTGYELQECYNCPQGKYISNSNDPSFSCFICPPSGICPNKGKPIFPESNVKGEFELAGPLLPEDRLKELLATAFGIDPDLLKIEDYAALAESMRASRRVQTQRRLLSAYKVQYRVYGDATFATRFVDDPGGQMANLTKALSQLFPNSGLSLESGRTVSMTSRLPGESWLEVFGVFTLQSCPMGYLLVNTTVDSQECYECELSSYTLDMFYDCSGGICGNRVCTKCPIGVECRRGSNPPWMHFIPKMLKIGPRSIEWATIKGVTADHKVNSTQHYDIFYDNYTGDASIRQSYGQNPQDYIWEYVVDCTDQTQPCDPLQIPGFYLRKCPRGTQLINTTIGTYDFDMTSQQCSPCGSLNYIVDPNDGGKCQECPKGARCPDGDLFIPQPDGAEWEIIYSGPRHLDAVKRIISCPPGYYMERDNRYPLEDRCLECKANTYLLDQSNFSACLSCPVGATCAGGADVTTLAGFWLEPDNWTNPALAPKTESSSNNSERRFSSAHMWREHGDVAPFLNQASRDIQALMVTLSAKLGIRRGGDRQGLWMQRRATDLNDTRRPRSAKVHRCRPGSCTPNNVCTNNRTGAACGLCPAGWAAVATGCESCPPPDDPHILFLQLVVFVGGGIMAFVAYILASWTPLMGAIPLPDFVIRGILLFFGIDPEEENEPAEEQTTHEEGRERRVSNNSGAANAGATGTAGAVRAGTGAGEPASGTANDANSNANLEKRDDTPVEPKPKSWSNKLILQLRETYFQFLRFRPKRGTEGMVQSIKDFVTKMRQLAKKVKFFFAPLIAVISLIYNFVSKAFTWLSWFGEFAEKHKLTVHMKIVVGYVQVLGSFASFNVEWPKGLTTLMNDMGSLFQFNVVELPKLSCLWAGVRFESNLIATTAGPVGLALLFGLPIVACCLNALCFGWTPERREILENLLDRFYGNVLFGAFLIYPVASLNSLQAFNCHKTLGVLNADFRVECPPLKSFLGMYSIGCFVLYPVGIPFWFYTLMIKMEIPAIARDKRIRAGFSDMVRLFNKMNATLECKLIAQMIGNIEDDVNEYARRIEDIYRRVCQLEMDEAEANMVFESDILLHRAIRGHFQLKDDENIDFKMFDHLVRKIVALSHAFTGMETIQSLSAEQVDLLAEHQWPSSGATISKSGAKINMIKEMLGKGKKKTGPQWVSPFGIHFPNPRKRGKEFYPATFYPEPKSHKDGSQSVPKADVSLPGTNPPDAGKKLWTAMSFKHLDEDTALEDPDTLIEAKKQLELKVEELLSKGVLAIPLLTWDPASADPREVVAIRRIGTIFGAYQVKTWFWELIEMMRKFLMVGLLLFVSPGQPAQLGCALLITLFFLFGHLILQPFSTPDLNQMQAVSQGSLTLTLFVGLMMIIDTYLSKEQQAASSGPWGVDIVDPSFEMNHFIFSLLAVVVNITTMIIPPLMMFKNMRGSLPSPKDVPGLITTKIAGYKASVSAGLLMVTATVGLAKSEQEEDTSGLINGLRWTSIGSTQPTEGRKLSNPMLSQALTLAKSTGGKVEFKQAEWDAFGINDLKKKDFIKSGDSYFTPVTEADLGEAASGLKWLKTGEAEVTNSHILNCSELTEALTRKSEFTILEWEAFGIKDLRMCHFVKSGDSYFKPADTVTDAAMAAQAKRKLTRPRSMVSPKPLQPAAFPSAMRAHTFSKHGAHPSEFARSEPKLLEYSDKPSSLIPSVHDDSPISANEFREQLLRGTQPHKLTPKDDLDNEHPELISNKYVQSAPGAQLRLRQLVDSSGQYDVVSDSVMLLHAPLAINAQADRAQRLQRHKSALVLGKDEYMRRKCLMEELSSDGVASLESKASLLQPSDEGHFHPKPELKVREGSINMRHTPLAHMNSMPDLRKRPQIRPGAIPVSGPIFQQKSSDELEDG